MDSREDELSNQGLIRKNGRQVQFCRGRRKFEFFGWDRKNPKISKKFKKIDFFGGWSRGGGSAL